jgi:hypothetical protein
MQKLLLVIGCVMMLAACGPQYSTEYRYFPPKDKAAKACAEACLPHKTNCDLACTMQQQQCYQRARMQDDMDDFLYRTAYWRAGMGYGAGMGFGYRTGMYSNRSAFCRADVCFGSCLSTYHQCFTQCGGKIEEHTVCTANCPSAPPAPAPAAAQ